MNEVERKYLPYVEFLRKYNMLSAEDKGPLKPHLQLLKEQWLDSVYKPKKTNHIPVGILSR